MNGLEIVVIHMELTEDIEMTANTDYEWTDSDLNEAKVKLYDAIYNGAPWDENLESYRVDALVLIESILFDKEDDKLARMKDVMHTAVTKYCNDEVNCDPNRYCEVSDDYLDEAA